VPNLRAGHLAAGTWIALAALAWGQAPPAAPTPAPTPSPTPAARPAPAPRPTPPPGPPDVYFLRNGDRVTGRTLSRGKTSIAVQTPFGRLAIPRSRIARIVRPDGSEEVINGVEDAPAGASAAAPAPAPTPVSGNGRLAVAITGKTFWQAWDRKETERDPTLRLELRLDEDPVVVYGDGQLDEGQIEGALVNSFSFAEGLTVAPAPGVRVHPAEVRPGRIVLKIDLPTSGPATRRLRLAYQVNAGTNEEPAWKDVASAATDVTLSPSQPSLVEVRQERGRMEFAGFPRRRMKNVETFELHLTTGGASAAAP
jgi:hypothetical protein